MSAGLPADLVEELLQEYAECKRRYFLADYAPAAINGGRFCEAVVRILQHLGTSSYTSLSEGVKVDQTLNKIENFTTLSDGLRLHAVRAIRLIYGIRNNRDNGHLRDDIDPNLQDATVVISCMDWILAELVRVAHDATPESAQEMIATIVTRDVPLIEVIDGRPVALAKLARRDHVLVLLYWSGNVAVSRKDLRDWLPEKTRRYMNELLRGLQEDLLVHTSNDMIYLTRRGVDYVESNGLLGPA
ncbi:hypothetical protein BJF78_06180 [Pseudonocardia sp. CNS-139]|nr:hypothetical protein BJF78_06180 [Pseudonocardia sp. CNS-139]